MSAGTNLVELHWNAATNAYQDWGVNGEAELVPQHRQRPDGTVEEFDILAQRSALKTGFVEHYGYVSLFPLLLNVIPHDSAHIPHLLKTIRSEGVLWSPYPLID